MATYAIGDIQGCFYAFQALLKAIDFRIGRDRLWLVGDMINRGSGSLEMLRWCVTHQSHIKVVLGNHDLHALAVAHGLKRAHRSDTLHAIIAAPDAHSLLTWLRHQPLLVSNDTYTMVHAGLLPQWQLTDARAYAKEVETALQSTHFLDFLANMYGNSPGMWQQDLQGFDRLRVITNAMTRLRICSLQGEMQFDFKGTLTQIPQGFLPWFEIPDRQSQGSLIICGHWSALGLHQRQGVFALDTGCLWGGKLTAMCLETQAITQVPCDPKDRPLKI